MEVQNIGNVSVARLMERVDSITSREVESVLQGVIAANPRQVICDFAGTKYISSAGLRVILSAAKSMKKAGGQLVLVCAKSSYVYEVLETAGFTQTFPVFETLDKAGVTLA